MRVAIPPVRSRPGGRLWGVTCARELGVREITIPTAGNAGGAWSLYAARAGIRAHVAILKELPHGLSVPRREG